MAYLLGGPDQRLVRDDQGGQHNIHVDVSLACEGDFQRSDVY